MRQQHYFTVAFWANLIATLNIKRLSLFVAALQNELCTCNMIVALKTFHFAGHTLKFDSQTLRLELQSYKQT